MNILIIEHANAKSIGINKILSIIGPGKNISKFNNIGQANNWLKTNKPDLILMDIRVNTKDFSNNFPHEKSLFINSSNTADYLQISNDANKQKLLQDIISDNDKLSMGILKNHLNKLVQLLEHQRGKVQKLSLPTVEGVEFITINDIIRCQSNGGYTDIFLVDNKREIVTKKIIEVEKMLEMFPFYRIHRSHLINVNYVRSFKRSSGVVSLDNEESFPVSRRKKEDFLSYLASF